jgi:hypothetical protein
VYHLISGRMLDKILYVVDKIGMPYTYYNLFITLLIDRYNVQLLQILRLFLLIPNKINKFMDLRGNCLQTYTLDRTAKEIGL